MVDLLDDLYDAAKVETEFAKPWKDSEKKVIPPVRTIEQTIEVDGKKKQATKYVYEVTEPKCSLMARRVAKTHPLLRLLREQIKLVIRTVPKAREVYTVRAETGHSGIGETLWEQITKCKVEKISGSHRLGVEPQHQRVRSSERTLGCCSYFISGQWSAFPTYLIHSRSKTNDYSTSIRVSPLLSLRWPS